MKGTKHFHSLGMIALAIVMMLGMGSMLSAQDVTLHATLCDGYGVNHGWIDVDKAEGYLGAYEYSLNDYACKTLHVNPYRLLKAYDFDRWAQEQPISAVRAYVNLKMTDTTGTYPDLLVQFRCYNLVDVIAKTTVNLSRDYVTTLELQLPVPEGGWTQEKVDALELWIGAKEDCPTAHLHVYYFTIEVDY